MHAEDFRYYFAQQLGLHLHEDTFQPLGEMTWICKATTMFHVARGTGPERSGYVLYQHGFHLVLEESALPGLLDWCLGMSTKKKA